MGNAMGDAILEGGPLFISSVIMRLAKSLSSEKEIMSFDGKEFDR